MPHPSEVILLLRIRVPAQVWAPGLTHLYLPAGVRNLSSSGEFLLLSKQPSLLSPGSMHLSLTPCWAVPSTAFHTLQTWVALLSLEPTLCLDFSASLPITLLSQEPRGGLKDMLVCPSLLWSTIYSKSLSLIESFYNTSVLHPFLPMGTAGG